MSDNALEMYFCLLYRKILSCKVYAKQVTVTSIETRKSIFVTEFKYNAALHELLGLG